MLPQKRPKPENIIQYYIVWYKIIQIKYRYGKLYEYWTKFLKKFIEEDTFKIRHCCNAIFCFLFEITPSVQNMYTEEIV